MVKKTTPKVLRSDLLALEELVLISSVRIPDDLFAQQPAEEPQGHFGAPSHGFHARHEGVLALLGSS